MRVKNPSISIFFPFFNDWGTVGSLAGLAISTVEKITDNWEIIIINDGSKEEDREGLELIIGTFWRSDLVRGPTSLRGDRKSVV